MDKWQKQTVADACWIRARQAPADLKRELVALQPSVMAWSIVKIDDADDDAWVVRSFRSVDDFTACKLPLIPRPNDDE